VRHQIGRNCRCALNWDSALIGIPPAMHTDRKIGFAMGILLIGIVAALFFRNEPLVDSSVPTVRRERELNQRLRERDVAVYLKDDVEENQKPESSDAEAETEPAWTLRDVLKNMDARNKTIPSPVVRSEKGLGKPRRKGETSETDSDVEVIPRNLDEQRERTLVADGSLDDESGVIADTPRTELPPLMPVVEPIPGEKLTSEKSSSQKPGTDDPVVEPAKNPAPVVNPEFQPPAEFDEYVVKYGDTLSGIAQKMLGAQSRYQEIFEANRDRMASPDRLDVGKPIRIPRTSNKSL
jgi:LysM repeat protein